IARLDWHIIAAVVMPDHVHLLAGPRHRDAAVGSLSAAIKRAIRKRLRADWQWQPGCFDRLLRREESAEEKWEYIRENPVRAGLVSHWSDWPYRIGFELQGKHSCLPQVSKFGKRERLPTGERIGGRKRMVPCAANSRYYPPIAPATC